MDSQQSNPCLIEYGAHNQRFEYSKNLKKSQKNHKPAHISKQAINIIEYVQRTD